MFFRTVVSLILMVLAGIVGIFAGAVLNSPIGGAILFVLITGFVCVIYVLDNSQR